MDIKRHFDTARRLADKIDDWDEDTFSWNKAYVSSVFAALAYEEVPQFELNRSKRAKIIPCDNYQAHVARWETEQRSASLGQLELGLEAPIEVVVRGRVLITASVLRRVIFVSLRGTTMAFADFKADLDFRKVKYSFGFGRASKLHRGFLEAMLECFDEVVDKVADLNKAGVPVYITGHSLGGAMAALFHARLFEVDNYAFRNRYRHHIAPSRSCYTFGMPRYGNMAAMSMLPQPFHTFNELDAVPTLPPKFIGFADSANERCVNAIPEMLKFIRKGDFGLRSGKGIATVLGLSDHRIERYVERLDIIRSK